MTEKDEKDALSVKSDKNDNIYSKVNIPISVLDTVILASIGLLVLLVSVSM